MTQPVDFRSLRNRSTVEKLFSQQFDSDEKRFLSGLDSGLNKLLRTDLKKAALFLKRAAICFEILPKRFRARHLAMQARLEQFAGRYREALKYYRQAEKIAGKDRQFLLVAQTRRALTETYMYLGQYKKALEAGRRAPSARVG